MDGSKPPNYKRVCQQLLDMERFLLRQLALALRADQSNRNIANGPSLEVRNFLETFLSETNQTANSSQTNKACQDKDYGKPNFQYAVPTETILDPLQKVNSFLMVLSKEKCIYISENCPPLKRLKKEEIIGKSLEEVFHPEDKEKLNSFFSLQYENNKNNSNKDNAQVPHIESFATRLGRVFNPPEAQAGSFEAVHCISVKQTVCKEMANIPSLEGKRELLVCLMTPAKEPDLPSSLREIAVSGSMKAPPNQTVNSRAKIPQPDCFTTRQNISGKMTGVNPQQLLKSMSKAEVNTLVKGCLTALQAPLASGTSLYQILHKQVLQQAQATSQMYKFRLPDGAMATALTKSKLMGHLGQPGEPPFIVSFHSIYRDGNLQGLDETSVSPAIRSILSGAGPPVKEAPPASSPTSAPNIISSSSATPSPCLSYTTFKSTTPSSMNSTDFLGDLSTLTTWPTGVSGYLRPRNSAEVARELLASTGAHGNGEEIANGVLSPPPHLDGHLVHTVGSKSTKAGSAHKSHTSSTSSITDKCDSMAGSTDNLATFPGPPCVDLSCLSKDDQTLPICTTTSPAATSPSFGNYTSPTGLSAPGRLYGTSPHAPPTSSPVTSRVRSASMNSIPLSVSLPKRSISNPPLEEGGSSSAPAAEPEEKAKKRATNSNGKATAFTKQSKLLTQLLSNKKVPVSALLWNGSVAAPPTDTPKSFLAPVGKADEGFTINDVFQSLRSQLSSAPLTSTTFSGPVTNGLLSSSSSSTLRLASEESLFSPGSSGFGNFVSTRPSVTTNVSKEELDELDDILNDLEDDSSVFAPSLTLQPHDPTLQQSPARFTRTPQQRPQLPAYGMQQTPFDISSAAHGLDVNNNGVNLNMFESQVKIFPGGNTTGVAANQNSVNNFKQTFATPQQGSMTPMFHGATLAAVPTGFEPCPNRVVGSAGVVSPRIWPATSSPMSTTLPQYSDFSSPDIWEGKETLVDLGRYPLPQGVNPRMAIPVPNNFDSTSIRPNKPVQINNRMQSDPLSYQVPNPMNRAIRTNGVAGMADQTMMQFNSTRTANPGSFPSPQMQPTMPGSVEPSIRANHGLGNHRQQGNLMQGLGSPLRRQLQLRLNHPSNSNNGFDSSEVSIGMKPQGILPQYPQQRLPLSADVVAAQKKNQYFLNQQRIQSQNQPDLQRYIAPNGHMSTGMRHINTSRFMTSGQPNATQPSSYRRMPSYSNNLNSPTFSPKTGVLPGNGDITYVRPGMSLNPSPNNNQQYVMTSVPPGQAASGGMYMGGPYQQQVGMTSPGSMSGDMSSPMTSQSPKSAKKSRQRKTRKNSNTKSKPDLKRKQSMDELSWNDVPSTGSISLQVGVNNISPPLDSKKSRKKALRRPMLQMTIGNMHQRPLATYSDGMTPPLEDAPTSMLPMSVSTPQNHFAPNRSQNYNLNTLLTQYKQKQDCQDQNNHQTYGQPSLSSPPLVANNYDVTSQSPMTSSNTLQWPMNTNTQMVTSINANSLLPCGDKQPLQQELTFSHTNLNSNQGDGNMLFLGGNDLPMNSNVNNNNNPPTPRRYTASVTSAALLSPPPDVTPTPLGGVTSQLDVPQRRSGERKASLLETLLLKKDTD